MRSEILNLLRESTPARIGPGPGQSLWHYKNGGLETYPEPQENGLWNRGLYQKGYVLVSVPNKLLPEEISRHLHTRFIGRNMAYEDVIPSTNDLLKKMALQGAPDGTVCVAEEQSVGKGRLARAGSVPMERDFWFSLLLKPTFLPQEAPKMTLLAAVAVVRAVRELCGVKAEIKWPNDILLEGRKLVGILTEMSAGIWSHQLSCRWHRHQRLRSPKAWSLKPFGSLPFPSMMWQKNQRIGWPSWLRSSIIWRLAMRRSSREGFGPILDEWRRYSVTLGRMVKVIAPTRPIQEKLRTSMKKGPFWCAAKMGMWSGS